MRLDRLLLLSSLIFVAVAPACGDGSIVDSAQDAADTRLGQGDEGDEGDASEAHDVVDAVAPDADDAAIDSTPDSTPTDTNVADTGPRDVFDPQPDAWATTWTRQIVGAGARVLALRYIGSGQETPGLLALVEVAGAAALTDADGGSEALIGEGARVVIANINPTSGAIVASTAVALAEGETLGHVTKAPNGFAFAVDRGETTARVVLTQLFAGALRASVLTLVADVGVAALALPASGDLTLASSGGAAVALALQLDAPSGGVLQSHRSSSPLTSRRRPGSPLCRSPRAASAS